MNTCEREEDGWGWEEKGSAQERATDPGGPWEFLWFSEMKENFTAPGSLWFGRKGTIQRWAISPQFKN
jgi:hypothetical protein